MTEEILTWNGLFGEAKLRGFRLQSLREDEHGYFHACWRDARAIYKVVDRRKPFTAAHDAFFAAIGEPIPEATDDLPSNPTSAETDLFG